MLITDSHIHRVQVVRSFWGWPSKTWVHTTSGYFWGLPAYVTSLSEMCGGWVGVRARRHREKLMESFRAFTKNAEIFGNSLDGLEYSSIYFYELHLRDQIKKWIYIGFIVANIFWAVAQCVGCFGGAVYLCSSIPHRWSTLCVMAALQRHIKDVPVSAAAVRQRQNSAAVFHMFGSLPVRVLCILTCCIFFMALTIYTVWGFLKIRDPKKCLAY